MTPFLEKEEPKKTELKAVIFSLREDYDEDEWCKYQIRIDEAFKILTGDKFYAGQDDGKWFYAVDPENEESLRAIFHGTSFPIQTIYMEDFPWDYNWKRDFEKGIWWR